MPWSCTACRVLVPRDSDPCPRCGVRKTAWTVVADATRTFVVSSPRSLRLLRGLGERPQPAGGPTATLETAPHLRVLPKATALALQDDGHVPATQDVVFAGISPGARRGGVLEVEVLFAGKPSEVLPFDYEAPAPGESTVYVPLVFVHGPEDAAGLSFEGLHVVDLTEDGGFAPEVEFTTLGLPTRSLEAEGAATWIELALLAEDGSPLADAAYRLTLSDGTLREGSLDAEGVARLEGIPPGRCQVEFPGQPQLAPVNDAHWVELEVLGEDGAPRSGELFEATLADGSTRSGATGADGVARLDGVPAGTVQVSFPGLRSGWEVV